MGKRGIRLIVDLSAYFKDHRKVARMFIKKSKMNTIQDVKQHITSLFNIADFFLTADGHFLPDSENISVLNNEELVIVTPHKADVFGAPSQESSSSTEKRVSKTKGKRVPCLELIPEEVVKKHKKRSKEKKVVPLNLEHSDEISSEGKSEQKEPTLEENKTEIRTVVPERSIIDSYRKPRLDASVRLSRRVDSPIVVTKYVPPPMTTNKYLAQKKINIVKIDVIKRGEPSISEKLTDLENDDTAPKTMDSSGDVLTTEKSKNASKKNSNHNQTEASNYTKIFLDQKGAISPMISNAAQNSTPLPGNLIDMSLDCSSKILSDSEAAAENVDLSASQPSSNQVIVDQLMNVQPEPIASNYSSVTADTKKKFSFGIIGPVLERLRESVDASGELANVNNASQKRKRVRKHRKRAKKVENTEESAAIFSHLTPHSTLNSTTLNTAVPKIHLKFDSDEGTVTELDSIKQNIDSSSVLSVTEKDYQMEVSKTTQVNGGSNSPAIETVCINDGVHTPCLDTPLIFGKESIENAPAMGSELQPKVGDVIAFKVLKISNSYTPEVSNYVVGVVQAFKDQNLISFKILSGLDELDQLEPLPGKLSLGLTQEISHSENQDFKWDQLLAPKLLFP